MKVTPKDRDLIIEAENKIHIRKGVFSKRWKKIRSTLQAAAMHKILNACTCKARTTGVLHIFVEMFPLKHRPTKYLFFKKGIKRFGVIFIRRDK
jgi:hypothetical protein